MTQMQLKETLRRAKLLFQEEEEEVVSRLESDENETEEVRSTSNEEEEEVDTDKVIVNAISNHATSKPIPLPQTEKKSRNLHHFF